MISRQIYVTPEQDLAIKERARAEGRDESEIVRNAIDRHIGHGDDVAEKVGESFENAMVIARSKRESWLLGKQFDRMDAYGDRNQRSRGLEGK